MLQSDEDLLSVMPFLATDLTAPSARFDLPEPSPLEAIRILRRYPVLVPGHQPRSEDDQLRTV